VRAASKRAPRESAEDKVLRLPALRLPSPYAGLFDNRICVPHSRGEMPYAFVIARRRKPPKQSRRFGKKLDCFAEPVIGPRKERTRRLAMTGRGELTCLKRVGLLRLSPPYARFTSCAHHSHRL
jgi:hypothetical protein